jgi:tRNA threonylcarbamoyl adenosine modification protein YeaZ/ribosomal-protein-alanine acetyltransferase
MKILSIDTAMAACSAALVDTDTTLPAAQAWVAMERGHAEALPPMVAEVMRASGVNLSAVDLIAVTTGPGTFTGVRIGLSFARGLGLARGLPVIGIDSLSAIAANEPRGGALLVACDARNDEVYAALFDADRHPLKSPHVTTTRAAAYGLPPGTRVTGSAAEQVIQASGRDDLVRATGGDLPVAAHLARLAVEATPGTNPAPLYLRAPDAKPQATPLRKAGNLSFRTVDGASAALLATLHGEAFADGWDAAAFAQLLSMPGAEAVLALEAEEPVGLLLSRAAADEAEIITIATRPGARRRGVGRQLLSRHLADLAARGVNHMFLEVAASNHAAIALYAAAGFSEVGRRKGYYQRPDGREDAIVMRRELAP